MERVEVFLDGGNFYHLTIKKMGLRELDFDFEKFANYLSDSRTIVPMGKRMYVGTVREKVGDPHSREVMSKQAQLFTRLSKSGWEIKTSKLRQRTERSFSQSSPLSRMAETKLCKY